MHECCFFAGIAACKKSVYRINLSKLIRILNGFSYLYLMITKQPYEKKSYAACPGIPGHTWAIPILRPADP
jgi:hypothetical protein